MLEFVIFAVTVVIFLIVAVLYLLPGSKKVSTVPGPEPVDYLEGNFPDIQASGSLHEYLLVLHATYGSIASFWWGHQYVVSIAKPDLFKQNIAAFDRPPLLFQLFEPLIGELSIQVTNGAEGRRRHLAYSKIYGPDTMKNYYGILNKLSDEVVMKLKELPEGDHVPLQAYMMAFAIKAMLRASMGDYFINDKHVHAIRQAYDYVWSEMENRLRGDMPEVSRERLTRFDKQKQLLLDSVKNALAYRRLHKPAEGEHLVIDAILDVTDSESMAVSDMITFLVAGSHTTGMLLTWALYFLASHDDCQQRLYDDIVSVLGDDNEDLDRYNNLSYLENVLNESLRCAVVAPYAARVQDFDIELGGHRIPAGIPVIHALGVAFQDPDIYPDPEKFDPDRFSPEAIKERPGYCFEPFGFAGKRKCPGFRLAFLECKILLSAIIKTFRVSIVEGQVVIPEYGLVSKPREEIWITLARRK